MAESKGFGLVAMRPGSHVRIGALPDPASVSWDVTYSKTSSQRRPQAKNRYLYKPIIAITR
jgi:hypothetical protein